MTNWNSFIPSEFEYDYSNDKLYNHRLAIDEVIECFSNDYIIRKNKKYTDRFKLIGKTDSGKTLCLIFQLKKRNIVRIITAWEV